MEQKKTKKKQEENKTIFDSYTYIKHARYIKLCMQASRMNRALDESQQDLVNV